MNREFIPYKQALALKELGFNEDCFGYYSCKETGMSKLYSDWFPSDWPNFTSDECYAPLYQQAFRWFREKHNLHPLFVSNEHFASYSFDYAGKKEFEHFRATKYKDYYEEAELACLDKLIQIVKNGKQEF